MSCAIARMASSTSKLLRRSAYQKVYAPASKMYGLSSMAVAFAGAAFRLAFTFALGTGSSSEASPSESSMAAAFAGASFGLACAFDLRAGASSELSSSKSSMAVAVVADVGEPRIESPLSATAHDRHRRSLLYAHHNSVQLAACCSLALHSSGESSTWCMLFVWAYCQGVKIFIFSSTVVRQTGQLVTSSSQYMQSARCLHGRQKQLRPCCCQPPRCR